jgi:hypothetical protein
MQKQQFPTAVVHQAEFLTEHTAAASTAWWQLPFCIALTTHCYCFVSWLQALSPEQIYKIYQTYIKELSSRLVELNQEACASEDITAQVEKLTKEVVSEHTDMKRRWCWCSIASAGQLHCV